MDLLERLSRIMEENGENVATLARKAGMPYTTLDGLFKRGWERAQISTIMKISEYLGISVDYLIYGSEGLSDRAQKIAAKFDVLSEESKGLIELVMKYESSRHRDAVYDQSSQIADTSSRKQDELQDEESWISQKDREEYDEVMKLAEDALKKAHPKGRAMNQK